MFKGFDKRLKRDVQRVVDARLRESEELSKHKVRILIGMCGVGAYTEHFLSPSSET